MAGSNSISGRKLPRYSGVKSFFRLPVSDFEDNWDVGIFGIPYDGATSYRPGSRFGPTSIRELSSLGRGYSMQRELSWFEEISVADIGDCQTNPMDQKSTYENIEAFWTKIFQLGRQGIAIGGDHSITLANLRACKSFVGEPLALIHFDAHVDTYPASWGSEYHHGAFLRHALEERLVDPNKVVQIGIRGPLNSVDDLEIGSDNGFSVFTVADIRRLGLDQFCKSIPNFDKTPTYITFDIDCLDPSYAPGTGTPVPGGLTSFEALTILQAINCSSLIGADLVEVSPPYDSAEITSLVAVYVLSEILNIMAASASAK